MTKDGQILEEGRSIVDGRLYLTFLLAPEVNIEPDDPVLSDGGGGLLLAASWRRMEGGSSLVYDTDGATPLTDYFSNPRPFSDIISVLRGIISGLGISFSLGIRLNRFSYQPEHLFLSGGKVKAVYFPFDTGTNPVCGFRKLLSRILGELYRPLSLGDERTRTSVLNYLGAPGFILSEFMLFLDRLDTMPNHSVTQALKLQVTFGGKEKAAAITSFPCNIGRSPGDTALVLEDTSIDGNHAIFGLYENKAPYFTVCPSAGIELNGYSLPPGASCQLKQGDVLKMGQTEIKVTEVV